MILAGRRLNDNMALYVAGQIVKLMAQQAHPREGRARAGARADVQGKLPGHPQLQGGRRRARAAEATAPRSMSTIPWADGAECQHEYGMRPVRTLERGRYDAAVVAVAHNGVPRAGRARRAPAVQEESRASTTSSTCSPPPRSTAGYEDPASPARPASSARTRRSGCWRAATRSSASTISTTTTTSP